MGFWLNFVRLIDPCAGMSVEDLLRAAEAQVDDGRVGPALRGLLRAWHKAPREVRVYLGLGTCCWLMRRNSTASACFRFALNLDPRNLQAKQALEAVEWVADQLILDIDSDPFIALQPGGSRLRQQLRARHRSEVEAAYRELCNGVFRPRR